MLAPLALALVLAQGRPPMPYLGGDPSEIPQVEADGGVYRVHGVPTDPLIAMKKASYTAVRLRVWNDPPGGFCDLDHTLKMAKRVKAAGLRLMIDFHYSDWWADPTKQNKPEAWKDLHFADLKVAIHDYSRDVIKALADQGTPAEVVQPGNEVTNGILWPESRLNINGDGWQQFMELTKSAIDGIREGAGPRQPKIMIHIDQGGRNRISRFFFDTYFERGGQADIIGLSYYPFWHGTMDDLKRNLADLSKRYKRPILVAETAFPSVGWNEKTRQYDAKATPVPGIPSSPEGQAMYLRKLKKLVEETPGGRGAGVLWWAPAWIGTKGSDGGWSRFTLFDGKTGEALPGLYALGK